MQLSIVISTRNRAPQLERCLASLLKLEAQAAWEVVVVDNGSTDNTQAVIARFRAQFPGSATAVVEPRPGLGLARNRGWEAARGELIAFTDDDCYPAENFPSNVIACFAEDARLGFIGGRILLFDPTDYRITIQDRAERQELAPRSFIAPGLIQGANFACRRAALVAVGGFDERFGSGTRFACEDIDLVGRIAAQGWAGAYDPRPTVYHHHGRKTKAAMKRLFRQYDRGRGAYYTKALLNSQMRSVYLLAWLRQIVRQSPRVTFFECLAGVDFLLRRA